ncbi:hypothetical protein ACVWZ3_004297 [Bradyrhizobium sp. i1.3.6]
MSRPWSSVPNHQVQLGGSSAFHEVGVHDGIGVRQPGREQADQDREREQRATDDEIGAELHAYLILGSITP